jgi:hypothetical protein
MTSIYIQFHKGGGVRVPFLVNFSGGKEGVGR